jgi:hypothetical protein
MRHRWEYKVLFIKSTQDFVDVEAILNEHGSDGWEAFAVQGERGERVLLKKLRRDR